MGLKIPPRPPDYGAGDDCLACWPAGKTPNYAFIRFWDIEACPGFGDPPNGYCFVSKQDPVFPCLFVGELHFAGYLWRATYLATFSTVQLVTWTPGLLNYFYAEEIPCSQSFPTNLNVCPFFAGESGHCHVTVIIDPIIIALTSGYHFATIPGILYDNFDVGMDHAIYRIAHTNDKTNVMIYLDKEEMTFD